MVTLQPEDKDKEVAAIARDLGLIPAQRVTVETRTFNAKQKWLEIVGNIRKRHTQETVVAALQSLVAEGESARIEEAAEIVEESQMVPEQVTESLKRAIDLQLQIILKLGKMVQSGERLERIILSAVEKGSVELADNVADWVELDVFRINTLFLINLLDTNTDHVMAFSEAAELLDVDADDLQELLASLEAANAIQDQASKDLLDLVVHASSLNSKFLHASSMDELLQAQRLATQTMTKTQFIKTATRNGYEKMQEALAKVKAL